MFHEASRQLQDRFDTRRLADRIEELLVKDTLGDSDREFVERADMFFLATADERGQPNCSYKGGDPGFVHVLDERTLAFPNYDGNGMYLSMGNIAANPKVGMLFIDFEKGHRLRLNGTATIESSDDVVAGWPEAQFVVVVRTSEVFPNCPRYIHRYQLVRRSSFVPQPGRATPVPSWKRSDWAAETLPADDPATDPTREVLDR
jgi:predicted pyridoxine 5'-phosphate oxidase superfamily flavin-nucleotide-binding protein